MNLCPEINGNLKGSYVIRVHILQGQPHFVFQTPLSAFYKDKETS